MSAAIAIIDYGMGNLHSVYKKLMELGAKPLLATTKKEVLEADKIILPGVGHFEKAIQNLKQQGIYDSLNEVVLHKKTPILGICLGMQLMAKGSEEGREKGFGWFDSNVERFQIENKLKYKVPQTGWNTVHIAKESKLLKGIADKSEFYFLHSYHFGITNGKEILTTTNFEYEFVSAVERGNIYGTQFHPEKSHSAGTQLFKNFIEL